MDIFSNVPSVTHTSLNRIPTVTLRRAILFADCQRMVPNSSGRRTTLTIAHTKRAETANGCTPRVGTPFMTWTFEVAAEAATDLSPRASVRKTASFHKTTECKSDGKLAAKFLWQPSYSAVIFLPDVTVASRASFRDALD